MLYLKRVKDAIEQCSEYEDAPRLWDELELGALPIVQWGPMIFSAPVLYEGECEIFLRRSLDMEFSPNKQEGKDYQIDECVFSHELHGICAFIMEKRIAPLFQLMTGQVPEIISSIQLARYTPESTAKTGWHVDRDSELSCIISLGPERHVGGGTLLRPYGPAGETLYVPPLPKGHGLFFNGRFVHHRGAEVLSGERLLLVYWLMGGCIGSTAGI